MEWLDFYGVGSGIVQMLAGFAFFLRFLHVRGTVWRYFLFALCGSVIIWFIPNDGAAQIGAYALLLAVSGILLSAKKLRDGHLQLQGEIDWKSAVLYAVLVAAVMQLCYGIVKSLWSLCYPLLSAFDGVTVGYAFMILGELASLLLFWLCAHLIYRSFSRRERIRQQYLFMILVPVLMIFFMEEYINSIIYGVNITDGGGIMVYTNHYQMLAIQLLGIGSLFCILFAYRRTLQSVRLSTEVSLLAQQERSLNQYVEEAKARYERTVSFRHDVKNHISVVQKLLQGGKWEEAMRYVGDMEEMAQELSFPVSTNNPVVDILMENKLGTAKSMGIDAECSLLLPCPCGLRDIDICIILSNALDNAVCACNEMEEGAERYIRVTGRMQGEFLFMEIENSFQGKGAWKEGTGLSNIRAMAEKYQGAVRVKTMGSVFLLHVLLIVPQSSENMRRQPESISRQSESSLRQKDCRPPLYGRKSN